MPAAETAEGFGPLRGVEVVELCEWVAAPATVRILAEMGAHVVKVEPLGGDAQRTQGPGFGCERTETEDPTMDLNNTNKQWAALNLKTEEGMGAMRELLRRADVFVTNLRTRALERLGLDYGALHEQLPALIWAQLRGYGEFGAEADTPGFDAVCWAARGGVANVFREQGESPAIPPQAFGDYNAASIMAGGILAALFDRTRTGCGDKVTCNLYGAAIWGGSIGVMATQFGAEYPKSRKRVPNPFNNTYRTSDGEWLYLCMPQYDKHYRLMMELTGNAAHLDDPGTRDLPSLKASGRQAEVIGWLEAAFASKTFEEWSRVLRAAEVPHQKCFDYADIVADAEAFDNDSLRWVEYEAFGKKALPMTPLRFEAYGDPPIALSKPIGYHTAEVLGSLGYDDAAIAAMEQQGAAKCWHGAPLAEKAFISERQRKSAGGSGR